MKRYARPELLVDEAGGQLGVSDWRPVTQQLVHEFAALTGDRQWIHTDPSRAAASPFGGTIAHGFLIASLVPSLLDEVVTVDGCVLVLNKGVERLSFDAAVPTGSRIRARIGVASARRRPRGYVECVYSSAIEVDGTADAACTMLVRYLYQAATGAAGS